MDCLVQSLFRKKLIDIFNYYDYKGKAEFCYLFGSYAKGYVTEKTDVNLCISSSLTVFNFVRLSKAIIKTLHKKIDLIRLDTIKDNIELINEFLNYGIRVY